MKLNQNTNISLQENTNWKYCLQSDGHLSRPQCIDLPGSTLELFAKLVEPVSVSDLWCAACMATVAYLCSWITQINTLTPCGDIDLGQHWFVAWQHQAITWTDVDFSSMEFCGIHLTTICSAWDINSWYMYEFENCIILKLRPHLPGAN